LIQLIQAGDSAGEFFKLSQIVFRMAVIGTAHLPGRGERAADSGVVFCSVNAASVCIIQIQASDSRRFALRHPRDGR